MDGVICFPLFSAQILSAHTVKSPAMAGSPERPVVLRRLGIVKDTDDTSFLQESRAPLKAEDALELFAAEHERKPRFRIGLSWVRAAGGGVLALMRRSAMVGVILVFAISMVGGVWLINRLFASSPSTTETPSSEAPANESGTPAESGVTASNAASSKKAPGDVLLPAGRRANAARLSVTGASRDQDAAQTRSLNAPIFAGRSGGTEAQSDQTDGRAALQVPFAAGPSSGDAAATTIDQTIYSADNQDVVPPQTLDKLPGPTISRWTTRTNAMEVIVSETGVVERVRLVTPPQRMPDIQALSVAKEWKFTPAMKDGRPVRYRLLLTWEVNP
jgi:TonB-like protein